MGYAGGARQRCQRSPGCRRRIGGDAASTDDAVENENRYIYPWESWSGDSGLGVSNRAKIDMAQAGSGNPRRGIATPLKKPKAVLTPG